MPSRVTEEPIEAVEMQSDAEAKPKKRKHRSKSVEVEEAAVEMPGDTEDQLKKRKRKSSAEEDPELEIDVNLPEPPSKKAKRKEKKSSKHSKEDRPALVSQDGAIAQDASKPDSTAAAKPDERSEYGVWIGNLPWTATKEMMRSWLDEHGKIEEKDVTRIHMPAPRDGKAKNRGFAYVDVTTPELLERAIGLSEKLMGGRKVLIKNAKSFEGRPEKPVVKDGEGVGESGKGGKEPSKRVFVGNLGFDVGKEELREHLEQAGEVEDVFLATFEDSGKCKGFGWVRFMEVGAAEAAVRGFVRVAKGSEGGDGSEDEDKDEEGEGKEKRKAKTQKRFINRLNGRTLRCEFAEDAQTRYKKRYTSAGGKDHNAGKASKPVFERRGSPEYTGRPDGEGGFASQPKRAEKTNKRKGNADDRREDRRKRHDARTIALGQSLASAPRASAAIVAGAGKKVNFD